MSPFKEGCLSLPNIYEEVMRPEKIRIKYLDENFQEHEEVFEGIRARIIQHEYEHLQGHVFVDDIAPLRKTLLQGKLRAITEGKCDVDYRMVFPHKKKRR
jgi:peptide deformylase